MKNYLLVLSFFIIFSPILLVGQNKALHFDGIDDEVRLMNEDVFTIGDTYTMEAWINATTWRDESWQGTIIGRDTQGPDVGFAFRCGKDGTLSFVMSIDNVWNEIATSPIMEAQVWNHVAVVIDNGTMSLFVNGEQKANGSYNGSFSTSNTLGLKIGASAGFPNRIFHGVIDEVRMWNVVKTGQELFDNSTEPLNGNEPGLVAYLPLDEGTGFTTANLSNIGNPGILVNMEEDDWVNGAELSGVDLGVTDILGPNLIHVFERPVEVVASIRNFGNEEISEFDVEFYINGSLAFAETVNEPISSGNKYIISSGQFIDATDLDNVNIEVRTKHPEDGNELNDAKSLDYAKQSGTRIRLFDQETHNFGTAGQTQTTNAILPADLQNYHQILLHIDLDCPDGGCDPWDQPAKISLVNDGREYEIARYITPYGIACGPWTVDVTDFKSVMGGLNQFRSYIQVWGGSGWDLTADLELIKNQGEALNYQKLLPLWESDYWVYGDPDKEDDLEQVSFIVDDKTISSHLRMTISGHGQGNTDNAAEFSQKSHTVNIDGVPLEIHSLWKNDCEFNPCNGQAGNWMPDRAGWCPGEAVTPYILNLTEVLPQGFLKSIDYELEDYTNFLNTGYNGGSHTEPHYRLHAFLVEASESRFSAYRNLRAQQLAIGTDNDGNPTGLVRFSIYNDGTVLVNNPLVSFWVNGTLIQEEMVDGTIEPGQLLVHEFSDMSGFSSGEHVVVAHVDYNNDQNIGDDYIKLEINTMVSNDDTFITSGIQVFPNPSTGSFTIDIDTEIEAQWLEIYNVTGQLIYQDKLDTGKTEINLVHTGIYTLKVTDNKNKVFSKRVIITK